ncbi:MAG: glycoside hydrolase family 2 TIM barrel-domain containing protein [Bacteroidales bacterium]|nr:glycoside hydrolase family 2 TIM barrel-domain containing protein [Bacteroidales bacterium]
MNKKLIALAAVSVCFALPDMLAAGIPGEVPAAPQIINIRARDCRTLDGQWKYIVDPYGNGYYNYRLVPNPVGDTFFADKSFDADRTKLIEYNFDRNYTLNVPGDWNTQDDKLYYYEGKLWYRTKFDYSKPEGKRVFLYFGAVNYEAVVALNGEKICRHTGGFTPFNIEVTDKIKDGENSLVVMVDNTRDKDGIPTDNCDWWNYGGITRSVCIVETPGTFIRDYSVQLDKSYRSIYGYVHLDGCTAPEKVTLSIPELKLSATVTADASGYAEFNLKARPELWSPENPKLYNVTISCGEDSVDDRIGFRIIETKGTDILLNGKKVFCRGVSIHEEAPFSNGRIVSAEQDRILLGWAKEMGCNFVRLAHYPHNEDMVRLAEEMGLMVWSEIPVYWTISWKNPDTYANARQQLVDMITRDINRANVVVWSVANETPLSDERLAFLSALIDTARELDPTRLISAAMEKEKMADGRWTVDDPLISKTDLISFNQYMGWYTGNSDICADAVWVFPEEKPVFISEFGAGALYGFHGDRTERFTEEYMADCYRQNIKMMTERMPGLAGTTPWVLKDFRSPRRALAGIQDDFNRKGLISEQGQKKTAFHIMKEWYRSLMDK